MSFSLPFSLFLFFFFSQVNLYDQGTTIQSSQIVSLWSEVLSFLAFSFCVSFFSHVLIFLSKQTRDDFGELQVLAISSQGTIVSYDYSKCFVMIFFYSHFFFSF